MRTSRRDSLCGSSVSADRDWSRETRKNPHDNRSKLANKSRKRELDLAEGSKGAAKGDDLRKKVVSGDEQQ